MQKTILAAKQDLSELKTRSSSALSSLSQNTDETMASQVVILQKCPWVFLVPYGHGQLCMYCLVYVGRHSHKLRCDSQHPYSMIHKNHALWVKEFLECSSNGIKHEFSNFLLPVDKHGVSSQKLLGRIPGAPVKKFTIESFLKNVRKFEKQYSAVITKEIGICSKKKPVGVCSCGCKWWPIPACIGSYTVFHSFGHVTAHLYSWKCAGSSCHIFQDADLWEGVLCISKKKVIALHCLHIFML